MRISIGTKFLAMIVLILGVTLTSVIVNATRMFRADNLDAISLSSDLLAASKAAEVRSWADGLLWRAQTLAAMTHAGGHPLSEPEILSISPDEPRVSSKRSWYNRALGKRLGLDSPPALARELERVSRGPAFRVKVWRAAWGGTFIAFRVGEGRARNFVVANADPLEKMFARTGPYSFALLSEQGEILAHRDPEKTGKRDPLLETPPVKRALLAESQREVHELQYGGSPYLAAFSKVGVARMVVLNLVPRATALETGNTLIRRSLLIGSLVFLLAFITAQLLTHSIVSPVRQLSVAARDISAGDYSRRVSVHTRDEIQDLASSFNRMGSEISRRIEMLAQINQAAIQALGIAEPQQLLDFVLRFMTGLFGFTSAVGVYREGDQGKTLSAYIDPDAWRDLGEIAKQAAGLEGPEFFPERGLLLCPIRDESGSRGLIALGGGAEGRELLDAETLDVVQTVLAIFSIDLENAVFRRELQAINAELERRVQSRTLQLAEAKKEVDDVMDNIQQGILTFGATGRINREHSKFANEIFAGRTLAGSSIVELLAGGTELGEDVNDWLKMVFEQPQDWQMLSSFAKRELRYDPGKTHPKDLEFEWKPIFAEERIAKMMLICLDVTEKKRLEAEIRKKEAEHSEQLEIIAQLVNHPREVVEQFIADFARNLERARRSVELGPRGLRGEQRLTLLRALHTIKGQARQFRLDSVQARAGAMESLISGGEGAALAGDVAAEFELLDASLRNMLLIYDKVAKGGGRSREAGPSISIAAARLDKLLLEVFAGDRVLRSPMVREALGWLVKSPVQSLFDRLGGLADSLAPELGYEVAVEKRGEEIGLDPRIQDILYDGLLHVVRNSLDHGGEPPEEREARGRPRPMTLRLSAERLEGGCVRIVVEDDGKGISLSAVRARAVEMGLIPAAKAKGLSKQELIQYVFVPGFTTKSSVTEISGRGVGMDVVKNAVERQLNGKLRLSSTEDQGTRLEIEFPAQPLAAAA